MVISITHLRTTPHLALWRRGRLLAQGTAATVNRGDNARRRRGIRRWDTPLRQVYAKGQECTAAHPTAARTWLAYRFLLPAGHAANTRGGIALRSDSKTPRSSGRCYREPCWPV